MPEQENQTSALSGGLLGLTLDQGIDELLGDPAVPEEDNPQAITDTDDGAEVEATGETDLDDEPEDEAAPEPEPEPEYLFEANGEQITLDEARDGYLRRSDYQRKTADLARQRDAVGEQHREVDALRSALQQERLSNAQGLQTAVQILENIAGPRPELATYPDQGTYAIAMDAWRNTIEKRDAAANAATALLQTYQVEQQKQQADQLKAAEERVLERYPEWRDPDIHIAAQKTMVNYLREKGMPEQDIAQISHPIYIDILQDAVAGQKARQAKDKAVKKTEKAKRFMKPGGRNARPQRQRRSTSELDQRLTQSGNIEDAIDLLVSRTENGDGRGSRRSSN